MTIAGFRLSWLQRRWWVLVACTLAVGMVAFAVNRPAPTSYTAESVLLVRSGATELGPGNANEASRLAVTYSQLIPQDSQVIASVSATLGVSLQTAADAIAATNDANTSILRVSYTAPTSAVAINGARAIANALIGSAPAAGNFNGVGLSRLPDTATRNVSSGTALPVGALLGLLLGLVLVMAIERNNGRIESMQDVENELDCPVSSLQGLASGSILALLQRWSSLSRRPQRTFTNVAIVPATVGQQAVSQEVAVVFATTAKLDTASAAGTATARSTTVYLQAAGAPSTSEVGEHAVQESDVTVIVVAEGTAINDLRRSIEALQDFGVTPGWALYASRSVMRRARRHHGKGETVVSLIEAKIPALTQ